MPTRYPERYAIVERIVGLYAKTLRDIDVNRGLPGARKIVGGTFVPDRALVFCRLKFIRRAGGSPDEGSLSFGEGVQRTGEDRF